MNSSPTILLIGPAILTAAITAGLHTLGWSAEWQPSAANSGTGPQPGRAVILVGDQDGNLPHYRIAGARLQPPTTILVCGAAGFRSMAAAVRDGAAAAFDADHPLPRLVAAVDAALRRDRPFSIEDRRNLLAALASLEQEAMRLTALTPREDEILTALMHGLTAAEIAAAEHVSLATVRYLIQHVLTKLDVRSQLAAVALAHRTRRHRLPRIPGYRTINSDGDPASWLY